MDRINDELLGRLLEGYRVSPPGDDLLGRTRLMMHRHLAARREELCAAVPVTRKAGQRPLGLVVSVLVLGLLVCCNLFYAAAVGTVLKLLLPSSADVYLAHSLIGISVAGVVLMVGMVLTAMGRVFLPQRCRIQVPVVR